MSPTINPTGRERFFGEDEIIVSKTDPKGRITYANQVFLRVSGYSEEEILGQPHNLIRHPAMPRCVFKLLWDTIESGREIFAYVINMAKNGDHYWVFAHVTPTFSDSGQIVGFHSNRRCPEVESLRRIQPIYDKLLGEEQKHSDKREGLAASRELMLRLLTEARMEYEEFIFSI